jgi:iron complex outermembrane recepter protein
VSRTRIVLGCLLLLLPLAEAASAQVVEGRLVEDASGDAVTGGDILVTDDRASPVARAITDADGRFRVPLPAPGRYRITATRIGFVPWPPEAFEVRTGDTVRIEIRLRAAPVALDTVTVVRRLGRCMARPICAVPSPAAPSSPGSAAAA